MPIPVGPALGPIDSTSYGQVIHGIRCDVNEHVVYHVHAHLTVFVDGRARQVPQGVGIGPPLQVSSSRYGSFVTGGGCFYWLHTHAADGVIHIESPTSMMYSLGQFFDVWGQMLSGRQVGPATGAVTAYLDGKPFTGDVRTIILASHGNIQLDVGAAVPPQSIDWRNTGL